MNVPLFSVVIPTCHRNDLLAKCLDCLAPGKQAVGELSLNAETLKPEILKAESGNQIQRSEVRSPTSDLRSPISATPAFTYEVIVTDDGSKTTAQELIQRSYPWAKWIEGPKRGPAANRNHGAKHSEGEWLVFTDDDCLPDLAFLSGYWEAAMKNDAPVLEGKTSPAGIRTRVDMECPINETGGYLWSCNLGIRKELFFELDGFDANFPGPAMEDVDFRTRLLKAGKVIKFVSGALALHPWRLKKEFSFLKLHSESVGYFVTKHPEKAGIISLTSLAFNIARQLIRQIPPIALACRGRGLGRELLLTFYTTYALVLYSKRQNLHFPVLERSEKQPNKSGKIIY